METKLNPNQISGGAGGALVGELYIDDLRQLGGMSSWVELSPDNPTAVKCNNNAEYIVAFRKPFSNDGMLFTVENVVALHYNVGGFLESYNWGTGQNDVVMNTGLGDYSDDDPIRLRCVVNGTTRTWYYDVNGAWVALTHDEGGTMVASSFTDTGIDTASTAANILLNNPYYDNPCTCKFCFSAFRITDNGHTVFDGSKAVKGVDYQTYKKDGENTVPAVIRLTHYL